MPNRQYRARRNPPSLVDRFLAYPEAFSAAMFGQLAGVILLGFFVFPDASPVAPATATMPLWLLLSYATLLGVGGASTLTALVGIPSWTVITRTPGLSVSKPLRRATDRYALLVTGLTFTALGWTLSAVVTFLALLAPPSPVAGAVIIVAGLAMVLGWLVTLMVCVWAHNTTNNRRTLLNVFAATSGVCSIVGGFVFWVGVPGPPLQWLLPATFASGCAGRAVGLILNETDSKKARRGGTE